MAVEPTAALLREKLAAAASGKAGRRFSALKWLESAKPEVVAYLAARVALGAAMARASFQTTTRNLGEAIIHHVEMESLRKKNAPGYRGLVGSQKGKTRGSKKRASAVRNVLKNEDARAEITVTEKIHLGTMVLETLIEATGLFEVDLTHIRPRDRAYVIRPTELVEDWLERQHARCELLSPMLLPMIVRPKRWRTPKVGGYLGSRRVAHAGRQDTGLSSHRIVKSSSKTHQSLLAETSMPLVYEAVNHIQETPWRINRRVLEVMREVWDGGGTLAGLPPREDETIPERPEAADVDDDVRKAWNREAAMIHEANAEARARRLRVQTTLWLGEKFVDEPEIYFPHSMDFRGRVYPMPAMGVHPQADDPGKALLEFAHGLPVGPTGGFWLAVHIANLFGVDKVSFKDRVDWTYAHSAELIDSALNPLDGNRFWTTADSPWMALAAAFDFADFLEHGEAHVSRLPIPLDGSNSGLQHFSAMLRDPVGAAAVNLLPAAEPQDVYMEVGRRAQAVVDADPAPEADPWRNGKVIRAISKRPTMTFVYSATRFGMQDMILSALRDLDRANAEAGKLPHLEGADNYAAALYLSHVMYEAISEVVSAASGAMGWLRDVARVAVAANEPIRWTTPDGLPVEQSYRELYGRRVKAHWMGRQIKVTLAVEGSGINSRGQINGIAPNFVHSLDAAHLRAVARGAKARGIDYLAVIHDSFGTHAARTDELVTILRETFVDQYRPDVLARLRDEIVEQLPPDLAEQIPPLPPKGTLDLDDIERSPYVFA
ncbi:DNA-directed RNA polymerase [Sphingomonas sp. J315]|uniref:DNA-directed RNA polymerase n=1 Tax=Sphingomonas sp. J315 TaxID=2898433 RepID=UPI0021AD9AE2|nr:DNA-directed RNA polymerase [Sphingomonas sp. J315]UUY00961.1 hypothetical protein LRS08_07870 [Sphingomonas sp. J315]